VVSVPSVFGTSSPSRAKPSCKVPDASGDCGTHFCFLPFFCFSARMTRNGPDSRPKADEAVLLGWGGVGSGCPGIASGGNTRGYTVRCVSKLNSIPNAHTMDTLPYTIPYQECKVPNVQNLTHTLPFSETTLFLAFALPTTKVKLVTMVYLHRWAKLPPFPSSAWPAISTPRKKCE
jgi:hypothetical protein